MLREFRGKGLTMFADKLTKLVKIKKSAVKSALTRYLFREFCCQDYNILFLVHKTVAIDFESGMYSTHEKD